MIAFLHGVVASRGPDFVVLDVGGIGFLLKTSTPTSDAVGMPGTTTRVHTCLLVRDENPVLYGFASESERRLFRDLLRVSGVGPKIGLALLSGMTVDAFLLCVEAEDVESLVRVPGIGRKTAERLVIEMRDRIRTLGEMPATGAALPGGAAGPAAEAYAAMVSLGYRPAEVAKLLKKVTTEGSATEDIIREALKLAVSK